VDATGVSRLATVLVTFSEPVLGVSGETLALRRVSDGAEIPAVVSMPTTRRALLDPVDTLAGDEVYEVVLTNGITDVAGNSLSPTGWRFTTLDTVRPTVTNRVPVDGATGVDRDANVSVTFSERVTGVSASTMTLSRGTIPVTATVTYDAATRTATLDPNVVLLANARYTVKLTTGIKDARGNTLADPAWRFTTGTTTGSGPAQ
jgi:hypothetical protein